LNLYLILTSDKEWGSGGQGKELDRSERGIRRTRRTEFGREKPATTEPGS